MNYTFLINTITAWEEPPRARHHVTFALSRKYKVVFIAANKVGFPALRSQKIHDNLTVITPYFPIDMRIRYRIPILNEIFQGWLFQKIASKYKDYHLINFDFTATRVFKHFKNVIFYCNDSFSEISSKINPAWISKYHHWCEARTASRSKFCVAISKQIRNDLLKYNPNTVVIPLGSPDIEEYQIRIPSQPSENKIIQVGLVAVIKKLNMSYDVINLLLEDETISLTLIGPIEEGFMDEIKKKDKLIVKGTMTGKELYEEINKFDVAIAPYCTKFNNEIFTATGGKIYHYLSVGKPVVISYMTGLAELGLNDRLIYPAMEEEDFPVLVHKAHEENNAVLIKERMDFAKENTWTRRMEDLLAEYEKNKP